MLVDMAGEKLGVCLRKRFGSRSGRGRLLAKSSYSGAQAGQAGCFEKVAAVHGWMDVGMLEKLRE